MTQMQEEQLFKRVSQEEAAERETKASERPFGLPAETNTLTAERRLRRWSRERERVQGGSSSVARRYQKTSFGGALATTSQFTFQRKHQPTGRQTAARDTVYSSERAKGDIKAALFGRGRASSLLR